ncbi:MAG TPA: hypothetical protein VG167_00865 [Verrucomicrobiae bacterium]|nr:hypothetical protein [Verrucomicrobiae bacterium]
MGGGGGKGGKSGSGSGYTSYDYYGTIAGLVRCGPVDTLRKILIDGEVIWEGPINRHDPGVGNPYWVPLTDPKWFTAGGQLRFWWGDDDQIVADPSLVGHPPYRGFSYIVFCNFLFGRERTTMGNVEVIADAAPRPPASIIPATDWDGNSVNPWAVLAELLTSIHGTALPAAKLDAASWRAAHDALAGSAAARLLGYCAPLLTDQNQLPALCNDLLSLCDGGMRPKGDGTIEAYFYPTDPGDLAQYTVLTANELTAPPEVSFESWDAVPTGVQVNFVDGDNWFVDWALKQDDLRALRQAVEPRRETLQAQFVIRKDQALKLGAEWCKRMCQPQISGSIEVRPEKAVNPDGTPLRNGNRFLLDIDPEPGGGALLQLCRVVRRRTKATGPVKLEFTGEVNQPATPYVPTYTPPDNEEVTVAALPAVQIVPRPLALTSGAAAVSVLAQRGDDLTVGAHLEFDVDGGTGTFTRLGDQTGFAVPCELALDFAADAAGPLRATFLDTRDQNVALTQPGNSGGQNDQLLLVVYHVDVDGYLVEDGDGSPVLEWLSIVSSAAVAGNIYDFTVLRARLGSDALDWATGDKAWILPRSALLDFRHGNFPGYVASSTDLVFRLSPYSRIAEYDGAPVNLPFRFPGRWQRVPQVAWTTPVDDSFTLAADGNLTPAATITDNDSNLTRVTLYRTRLDTGAQVTLCDVPFAPARSKTLAQCFSAAGVATPLNFPGQAAVDTYYTLTLRASDATGNVTESRRNLVRLATAGGGGGFAAPSITPHSTMFFNSLAVTVTAAAPATQIQYYIGLSGGTLPGAGYTTVLALVAHLTLVGTKRVWARCGDGANWSAWVFDDYTKDYGGIDPY